MQEETNHITSAVEHATEYVKIQEKIIRLKIVRSVSLGLSALLAKSILCIVALLLLIFAGLALSGYVNQYYGSNYTGYLVSGGCYLLLGLILWVFRRHLLIIPFANEIVEAFLDDDDDDKNNDDEHSNAH